MTGIEAQDQRAAFAAILDLLYLGRAGTIPLGEANERAIAATLRLDDAALVALYAEQQREREGTERWG